MPIIFLSNIMHRYRFKQLESDIIMYSCPICRYVKEWDDTWDDAKKEQVKLEAEAHYNYHIIPQTFDGTLESA